MKRKVAMVFGLICATSSLRAQVTFTSPLPFGILQVHGDHADLRLHLAITGYPNFEYKLSSDTDTSSPLEGWAPVTIHDGTVDTLIMVPRSLRNYALLWRTGLSSSDTNGAISGLTPGHIIGIAGQSNAVGWCWTMNDSATGDIRMLTPNPNGKLFWGHAHEPTGGFQGGPWIVMANKLYANIGDSLPIGIVNTAVGGTGLLGDFDTTVGVWKRNTNNPEDNSTTMYSVYGNALRKFRAAGSEIEWLTWIQGEADGGYGGCGVPSQYQAAFKNLIEEFEGDMKDTFQVYHLQIGGDAGVGNWIGTFPQVRQAELSLPLSTLVGTGVGLSVWDGRFHYDVSSLRSIGEMFAGAILKEQYGTNTPMYPPLMPDTVARLDSITDANILGHYCFSIGWTRGGKPVKLTDLTPFQYFGLSENGIPLDTSYVWYRISPEDSTRVQVALRKSTNDSITLNFNWLITYDAAAESDRAPLAIIDPASGDTIFATAFYDLPVELSSGPPASVREFSVQSVAPNPANNSIHCYLLAYKHQIATIELLDNLGAILRHESVTLEVGLQDIPISTEGLTSGTYWIVLRDENGNESVQRAVFFH
ncbi:MAG TPA: sialate O-acetylesterase [Candidatus Kapabacteria bacterium]|nr:sialate O-acetylesterase [Candidatus Kapabacteria bacterium]